MTIVWSILGDYYLSGNIPDILIPADDPMEVVIKIERSGYDDVIITEEYKPVDELGIFLNIRELVHNELKMLYETDDPFELFPYYPQGKGFAKVTITPEGLAAKSFWTVKGSIDTEDKSFDFLDFLQKNILSVGPQIRNVRGDEPVVFSFFSPEYFQVQVTAYNVGGSATQEKTYFTENSRDQLYTFNATFDEVIEELWTGDTQITQLDFQVQSLESSHKTYHMRLVKNEDYEEFSDYFLFENSIGGLDTIHLTGEKTEELRHEYLRAKIRTSGEGTQENEYQTIPLTAFSKNTGWIYNEEQRRYILDLFASTMRFHWFEQKFRRIYVLDYDGKTTPGQLNSKQFTFAYSRQYTGHLPTRTDLSGASSG